MSLSPLEKQVTDWIDSHSDQVLDLLKTLIRHRSIGPNEAPIQQEVRRYVEETGLEVDQWEPDVAELRSHPLFVEPPLGYEGRPNLVAIYRSRQQGRSLLFNSHIDVVPSDPNAWETDPWEPTEKNGRLHGRGASDMKSGVASATFAFRALMRCGVRPAGNVYFHYVVDEENTANGTLAAVLRGYVADAGISTEASDLEVQPAATGSHWFDVRLRGRSCSMSRRWEGVSAVDKAYRIIQAVQDFEAIRIATKSHPMYPDNRGALSCFIGMIQAGSFPSAPPVFCQLRGRMGTLPNEDVAAAKQSLIDHIHKAAALDPWLREHPPEVEFCGMDAHPVEIAPDEPIMKAIANSVADVTGRPAVIQGHDGGADTRVLIPYGKTPTPIFGPGTITQMHADNEWVHTGDVITAAKVYAVTIMRWCGVVGEGGR